MRSAVNRSFCKCMKIRQGAYANRGTLLICWERYRVRACASVCLCLCELYFWLWCCVHQNFYDLYQLAHSSNQHTKMENRRLNYANYVDGFLFMLWLSEWVCDCVSRNRNWDVQSPIDMVRSVSNVQKWNKAIDGTERRPKNAPNNSWRRRFSCHSAVNTDFC